MDVCDFAASGVRLPCDGVLTRGGIYTYTSAQRLQAMLRARERGGRALLRPSSQNLMAAGAVSSVFCARCTMHFTLMGVVDPLCALCTNETRLKTRPYTAAADAALLSVRRWT